MKLFEFQCTSLAPVKYEGSGPYPKIPAYNVLAGGLEFSLFFLQGLQLNKARESIIPSIYRLLVGETWTQTFLKSMLC